MLSCDICKQGGKGRYVSRDFEIGDNKKKLMTVCWECLDIRPSIGKTDKQMYEHISTPLFVHAGLKPNAQDKAKLAYMKAHNMSWGDLRKEKYSKLAGHESAMPEFQKHLAKYGTKNAPETKVNKTSKAS